MSVCLDGTLAGRSADDVAARAVPVRSRGAVADSWDDAGAAVVKGQPLLSKYVQK